MVQRSTENVSVDRNQWFEKFLCIFDANINFKKCFCYLSVVSEDVS